MAICDQLGATGNPPTNDIRQTTINEQQTTDGQYYGNPSDRQNSRNMCPTRCFRYPPGRRQAADAAVTRAFARIADQGARSGGYGRADEIDHPGANPAGI